MFSISRKKALVWLLAGIFLLSLAVPALAEVENGQKISSPLVLGVGELFGPYGMAYDEDDGAVIIADSRNQRICRLDLETFELTVIAGKSVGMDRFGFPAGGYKDGLADEALFNRPRGVAVAENGAILIADTGNHAIRQIFEGKVTTIAGGRKVGYKDARSTQAEFNFPAALVTDADGNIFVADSFNNVIRLVDPAARVTTYAPLAEDGEEVAISLNEPVGLALDEDGNLYVADSANHRIVMIDKDKEVVVLAGKPGLFDRESGYFMGGYLDGNGQIAALNFPKGLALDGEGRILVADTYNHVIREIKLAEQVNLVTTIAGDGVAGTFVGGEKKASFDGPVALLWAQDMLFVADHWNDRILVLPDGADYQKPLPKLEAAGIPVYLNGNETIFPDVAPFIRDGRVLVPIRGLAQAWDAEIFWNDAARVFTILKDGKLAEFIEMRDEFVIHQDRAMVQLRTLAEKLNLDIEWIEDQRIVVISN